MKMKIDDLYSIEIDTYCWTLVYENTRFDDGLGKEITTRNRSYHATLAQALNCYVDQSLKAVPDVSMVIKALGGLEAKIESLVGHIKTRP